VTTQLSELTGLMRTVLRNAEIELNESTRFEDLPAWDSTRLVSVVVEAEVRFDMVFECDEIEALHTAGDLLRLIGGRRALARV
jgi:acyl carrier protein